MAQLHQCCQIRFTGKKLIENAYIKELTSVSNIFELLYMKLRFSEVEIVNLRYPTPIMNNSQWKERTIKQVGR